ncbi:MAG: DUF3127 domain-containing protein [Flavobacteriales bacterium]|nr:DUF3127 domain-containing protein [Flavobacteriales bacterium]
MSELKLVGKIKVINPTQVVSDKFSKREFVVETQDQYPQFVMFQTTQDKCALLDGIAQGQDVEVSFNLRGREWTSPGGEVKYFNTLEAWRIVKLGNAPQVAQSTTTTTPANEEDDDLPF